MASSFKVTGKDACTGVEVGFKGGSYVGPRRSTKGRWDIRHCQGRGSGRRSPSEGKNVVRERIVHLATW